MSSFFTMPGEKKRKRIAAPDMPQKRTAKTKAGKTSKAADRGDGAAKKAAVSKTVRGTKTTKSKPSKSKARDSDDDSISGSGSDSELDGRPGSDEDGGLDSDADDSDLAVGEDDDADEAETAAERRLRLAERYLDNVRRDVSGIDANDMYAFDAEDVDRDLIAERLEEDVAEAKGRVYRRLADELDFAAASHCLLRWNARNINAVAVCAPYAYTVSSDAYLTKWRLQERPAEQRRQRVAAATAGGRRHTKAQAERASSIPARRRPERVLFRRGDPRQRANKDYVGHVGAILAVAASADGKFVATGGADRRLVVYDAATLQPLKVFTHHRDAVTGLVFRRGTNQLYSCSRDRTIKIWSLDELAYVQTLFGHQDQVVDIDALAPERCISVGTRDRTARLWKVIEETQLVFRGGGSGDKGDRKKAAADRDPSAAHEGSMDRVALLDDELFVTGSDNGALALWSTQKKKPLAVVPRAHGLEPALTGRETYDAALADPAAQAAHPPPPPQPRWITALRAVPYADVVLSGSSDGCVRVWRLSADKRRLEPAGVLGAAAASHGQTGQAAPGVVNDIAVFERGERGRDGLAVVVALGREHRLGRWGRVAGARNGAVVYEVPALVAATATVTATATGQTNGASL